MNARRERRHPGADGILASAVSREYRAPHTKFQVETSDQVRIAGVHLATGHPTLAVFCHGLFGSKNWRAIPGFLEDLASHVDVMAFDFRGHGQSGGNSTLGCAEVKDLRAVIRHANEYRYDRVVLIGESLGGGTAIRYGGLHGGVQAIATISAFASIEALRNTAARLPLDFIFGTALGRAVISTVYGARLGELIDCEPPIALIDRIAPTPLLLIQYEHDPFVTLSDARLLFERAGEPKELRVLSGGHAFSLHAGTRQILLEWMERRVL